MDRSIDRPGPAAAGILGTFAGISPTGANWSTVLSSLSLRSSDINSCRSFVWLPIMRPTNSTADRSRWRSPHCLDPPMISWRAMDAHCIGHLLSWLWPGAARRAILKPPVAVAGVDMDEMHVAIRYNFVACEKRDEEGMGCWEGYWEFGIWVGRGQGHCIAVGSKQCQIAVATAASASSVVRVFIASSLIRRRRRRHRATSKQHGKQIVLYDFICSVQQNSCRVGSGDAAANQY